MLVKTVDVQIAKFLCSSNTYIYFHQSSTPNLKLSPDEESDIAGLLSSTPQPIQDLVEFDDVVRPEEEEEESLKGDECQLPGISLQNLFLKNRREI